MNPKTPNEQYNTMQCACTTYVYREREAKEEGGRKGSKHSVGLPASLAPREMSNKIEIETSTMHMATSLLPCTGRLPTDSALPNLSGSGWGCRFFPIVVSIIYCRLLLLLLLLIADFFATWASMLLAVVVISSQQKKTPGLPLEVQSCFLWAPTGCGLRVAG